MSQDIGTTIDLVLKAKAGEMGALNALLDRYLERVHRIVRIRLGPKLRGRMESMDIVQEVMLRAIKAFDNFEPKDEAAFLHWISKLIHNEIRQQAGYHAAGKRAQDKEIVKKANSSDDQSVSATIPAPSIYKPSFQLRLKEEIVQLEKALDQLEDGQREIILMRQYEEHSFKEIGRELGINEDAARMQFVRAMDKLTDIITKDSE